MNLPENKSETAQNSNPSKNYAKKKLPKARVITFKFNPLVILVTSVLIIFLIFGLFGNRDILLNNITFDELMSGIKSNSYSQIVVENGGKIVANSKTFAVYEDPNNVNKDGSTVSNSLTNITEFEKYSLDDLVKLFTPEDFLTQLRNIFSNQNYVKEIIIGDNFLIATRPTGQKDILVENVTEDDFKSRISDFGLSFSSIATPVSKLGTQSGKVEKSSFDQRLSSSQFSDVWVIEGKFLGKLKPQFITKSYIDWTPSIYSFTDILLQQNVNLTDATFEYIPVNVASGITLNDVLTILTLVGFVILGFFIFKGAQGSGMGIMQFGQSKAKMFFGSKTNTTFKDVAGIDEAREELNELVEFLKTPNKFTKLGARIPKGVLMVGPPGTGKTLLARAIAGEAGVPFFHTSGSEFEEMLVGAGASRVRDLFAKAKKAAPALVFIDEIDAVARKRGTKIQSGATEQTLNQILVEMDGFEKNTNVIVLAATNRPDVLDPAILRPGRFDRQIRIDLPDMEGRTQILEVHGKNKPFSPDVDFEKVAKRTIGFTGADLENILNESAILAAKYGKKEIDMSDIEEAVSKVLLGPAKKSRKRTEKELNLVAYHEAGHAVVAKYTPESTPVDKISIVSRGISGGVTMFLPEKDEYIMSKRKLIADITVSLGGRAAEEVALDDISTGASNDIEKATAVARRMMQRFGMSDKLGLIQYGNFEENEYLGYAYSTSKEYSDKTAEIIDNEVKELIAKCYMNAVKILRDNREKLDKVASTLLEKEVLGKEEFEALF